MLSFIRLEIMRVTSRRQTLVAFVLALLFLLLGAEGLRSGGAPESANYQNYYLSFLYAVGQGPSSLFPIMLPLLVCLAAGDSLAWDRRSGFEQSILVRISRKRYMTAKLLSATVISIGFVLLVECIAFVYSWLTFPGVEKLKIIEGITPSFQPELFVSHPFLYVLLIMFYTALAGAAITLLSVLTSTLLKNIYLVIAVPFLLFIIGQFTINSMNLPQYGPLELIAGYMSSFFRYDLLEIPVIWFGLYAICFLIAYLLYTLKIVK